MERATMGMTLQDKLWESHVIHVEDAGGSRMDQYLSTVEAVFSGAPLARRQPDQLIQR
jgi:hypothetical protein